MDMVYRRSISTVGIIISLITLQWHLDALHLLILNKIPSGLHLHPDQKAYQERGGVIHSLMHDAHEILEIFALDRWFTRAWTYQELAVSTKCFRLLLKHSSGLRSSTVLGKTPGHVEIDLEKLAHGIANLNSSDTEIPAPLECIHLWRDEEVAWPVAWHRYTLSKRHVLDLDLDRFSIEDNNPVDTRLTIAARLLQDLEP
jgi:hypothetical protein